MWWYMYMWSCCISCLHTSRLAMIAFLQFLILKKDICLQYKYKYPLNIYHTLMFSLNSSSCNFKMETFVKGNFHEWQNLSLCTGYCNILWIKLFHNSSFYINFKQASAFSCRNCKNWHCKIIYTYGGCVTLWSFLCVVWRFSSHIFLQARALLRKLKREKLEIESANVIRKHYLGWRVRKEYQPRFRRIAGPKISRFFVIALVRIVYFVVMTDWKFDDFAKTKLRCVNFNGMSMAREKNRIIKKIG